MAKSELVNNDTSSIFILPKFLRNAVSVLDNTTNAVVILSETLEVGADAIKRATVATDELVTLGLSTKSHQMMVKLEAQKEAAAHLL